MENKRDFKGIWIPKEIFLNDDLSWTERILLIEIDSLDNEEGCFAGNEYLSKFLRVSEITISNAISKLKKKGYIKQIYFDGRRRILKSCIKINLKSDLKETLRQDKGKLKGTVKENFKSLYKSNNTSTNTPNNTLTNQLLEINNKYFEDFWDHYGRIGNKQKAKMMFERAIKEVSPEYLDERLNMYLNFIKKTNTFQKHASTWLNPKYKEFDNEYDISKFNGKPKSIHDQVEDQLSRMKDENTA